MKGDFLLKNIYCVVRGNGGKKNIRYKKAATWVANASGPRELLRLR